MRRALKILIVLICAGLLAACGAKNAGPSSANAAPGQAASAASAQEEGTGEASLSSADALREAKKTNTDTVAWLRIPGTDVDDAVMQSSDNSYYLRRDESGAYNQWGCYYADYYSVLIDRDSLQQNTVIYGHSQDDESPHGPKFSQLFRYLEQDFLQQNPNIYLTVGDEELAFEVCAVFLTGIDFYYINPTPSDEGFSDFAQTVAAKNEYIFSAQHTEQDKLLTLSSCSHRYDVNNTGDQRIVVMAKLLPEGAGQSELSVSKNPDPAKP